MEAVGVPVEAAGSPKGALEEAAVAGLKTGANAAAGGRAGTSVSAAGVRAKDGAAGGPGVAATTLQSYLCSNQASNRTHCK